MFANGLSVASSSLNTVMTHDQVLINYWGVYKFASQAWWRHHWKKNCRVTGPLCGEFTSHRWISLTKASDAELWCFLWSAPWRNCWINNREDGDLRPHRANYDVIVMGINHTMRMSASRWFLCSWWVHVLTMMTLYGTHSLVHSPLLTHYNSSGLNMMLCCRL